MTRNFWSFGGQCYGPFARRTFTTRTLCWCGAKKSLGQEESGSLFAHAFGTFETIGVVNAIVLQGSLESLPSRFLTEECV